MVQNIILRSGAANPNDIILYDVNALPETISPTGIASTTSFGTPLIIPPTAPPEPVPSGPFSIAQLLSEASCYACYAPGDVPSLIRLALLSRIATTRASESNALVYTQTNGNVTTITSPSGAYNLSAISPEIVEVRAYSAPGITSFTLTGDASLTSVSFGNLDGLTLLSLNTNSIIQGFSFNSLVTIATLDLSLSDLLSVINLPNLVTSSVDLLITGNAVLTNLSLPSLVSAIGGLAISFNPTLVSVSLPNWVPTDGTIIAMNDNALNASSVNLVLARLVLAGVTTCVVTLSGGSNSAPTGQGIIDKNLLNAAGNTIITN